MIRKNKRRMWATFILLVFTGLGLFVYRANKGLSEVSEAMKPIFTSTPLVFVNINQTIYVKTKMWGLLGNHTRIWFSETENEASHENDITFDISLLYYKILYPDSLMIYLPSMSYSEERHTNNTLGDIKVKITEYKASKNKEYNENYKEMGLTKISVSDLLEHNYTSVNGRRGGTYQTMYFIKDHLGSTRVVVNSSGIPQSRHDFYPFGMAHANPSLQAGTNRYLYNGKELQVTGGLKYLDYGARKYDPVTGRWITIDPLAESFLSFSSYSYALNNPIRNIDVLGMFTSPYYDKDGNFLGTDEDGFTGDIYITDAETFFYHSYRGVAKSDVIKKADGVIMLKDSRGLSAESQSNIYTHVLNQMEDLDFSDLFNGKVSIYTGGKVGGRFNGFNEPTSRGRAGYNYENGQHKITVRSGEYQSDLNHVEVIQNYLGVHEYYGHGIMNYSQIDTHWKAYDAQYRHPTFNKMPSAQKIEVQNRRITYKP